MAKKKTALLPPGQAAAVGQPPAVPVAPKAKAPSLESRVSELEGDLVRLAKLCGEIWGEPVASAALEIANKRQGA